MRTRDQAKYDSIVEATITLTNKLGIDGISISKIAKKAKVSPATIYIYFENKEDLFTKLYVDIRKKMSQGALEGLGGGNDNRGDIQVYMASLLYLQPQTPRISSLSRTV